MIFSDSNMAETPNQQIEQNAPGKPETTLFIYFHTWCMRAAKALEEPYGSEPFQKVNK